MTHFQIKDEDVPSWPIGSSIMVKFPSDGDHSPLTACAAMINVTSELKERIEQAAKALSSNNVLRAVQFYWPFEIITNAIYGQATPKQFVQAILEILNSDFHQAIPDEIARDAVSRMYDLDAITWVSVERPFFGLGGGKVDIGCTILSCLDFSTTVKSITASTHVPGYKTDYDSEEYRSRKIARAIDDLFDLASSNEDKQA